MINRSPWLWGVRQTAAGMTGRTSLGVQILQGKRAPGQSNPSSEYLFSQQVAGAAWPQFGGFKGFGNQHYFGLGPGLKFANIWYAAYYVQAEILGMPDLTAAALAELPVAKGSMSITPISTGPVADVSLGTVTWTMPDVVLDSTQDETDEMHSIAYNPLRGTFTYAENGGGRSTWDTALTMVLPTGTQAGDPIILYTTAKSLVFPIGAESVSDSVAQETIAIA